MICKIEGCENKVKTRGWCVKHYTRWRRHGDPNIVLKERHGYYYHALYGVWCHVKSRCYSPGNKDYKDYGGRGIKVCDEWMSPIVFIEWALPLWKKGLEIDRRDNDGDYNPENCHFITHKENVHNQRLLRITNTSGYRGVNRQQGKWRSRIVINGKQKHLGYFDSPRLAALRYDAEAYKIDRRLRNFF